MADAVVSQIKLLDNTIVDLKDKSAVANVLYNDSTNVITITKRDGTSTTITLAGGGSSNIWVGTRAQYDALATKNSNTLYITTDEDTSTFLTSDAFAAHLQANNPHSITAETVNTYTKSVIDNKINTAKNSITPTSLGVYTQSEIDALPTILSGTSAPSSSTGSNGDIFVVYTA